MGCTAPNQDYAHCLATGDCDDWLRGDLAGSGGADLSSPGPADGGAIDLARSDGGGGPVLNPDSAGPWKTVSFDISVGVTGGTTQATVIGPSDDDVTLSSRGAPFPLVIFSPGFFQDRKKYLGYGQRLASYGIVTVLQNAPNTVDHGRYRDNTIELLGWLLAPTGTDADKVKGRLDAERIGTSGHSLGGKISILVAAKDSRVKALIGIDPVDSMSTSALTEIGKIKLPGGLPIGLLGETTNMSGGFMPCAPAGQNFQSFYDKASPPALAVTFLGAAHMDFQDGCNDACARICPGGTAPRDRTNRLAVKYVTAYFLWSLKGEAGARSFLLGADFQKDVTAGYVTEVAK